MRRPCVFVVLILGSVLIGTGQPAIAQPYEFVEITIPLRVGLNPALRTPVATYEWQTYAGSPDPVEVRWIMEPRSAHSDNWQETIDYIINTPDAPGWSAWQPYSPPGTGTSWESDPPLDYGYHVFAVQGRDGSGNVGDLDEERNIRRVLVSARTTGPLLVVTGDHIDDIVTSTTTTPVTEINLDAGTPVSFCWTATAEDYGLTVTGYRYAWDIADPEDDEAWGMPFTPFAQEQECSAVEEFNVGTHIFYVEVIDYDGFKSRVPIQIIYPPLPVEYSTWGRIKALYPR